MRKFSPPFSSLLTHKISSTVYPKSQPPSSSSVSHRKCSSGFHRRNSHRPSDRGSSSRTHLPRFFDMMERELARSITWYFDSRTRPSRLFLRAFQRLLPRRTMYIQSLETQNPNSLNPNSLKFMLSDKCTVVLGVVRALFPVCCAGRESSEKTGQCYMVLSGFKPSTILNFL